MVRGWVASWRLDRRQWLISAFGGFLFLGWAVLLWSNARNESGDVLGDWVMNYSQGFVRRGLIGSVLLWVSTLTGLKLTALVPPLVTALYGAFLFFWLRVLKGRYKPFWYLLLVFSPATLLFSFFGSSEVGRKEVLHFAMLAVMAWTVSSRRLNAAWALALVLSMVAATLSHELILFYTPYYVMVAMLAPARDRRLALVTGGAMLLASACAALCVLSLAQPLDGPAMCSSLMAQGYSSSLCKGIIVWKAQSLGDNIEATRGAVVYFGYFVLYPLCLLMALAPVALWLRRYPAAMVRRQLVWFVLAMLVTLPAFVLALDWGRFIQIHLVSAMIVLALQLRRRPAASGAEPLPAAAPRIAWPHPAVACGVALACLSAALFWNMPNCCTADLGHGLLGKLDDALAYARRMTGH